MLDEEDGNTWLRDEEDSDHHHRLAPNGVAARYFAAHPEPKPWHDAKPGEAWAIEFKYEGLEESRLALVIDVGNSPFEVHAQGESPTVWVNRKDPRITAGRRIWPEPEETDDGR